MTDERQGETLWSALDQLPRGSGVIFRHYSLPATERRRVFTRIRRIARQRRLVLLFAGTQSEARANRAIGFHNRSGRPAARPLVRTMAVHSAAEVQLAQNAGADLIFLSPVFATRSHPGARPLGRHRFARLAQRSTIPVIALGGMTQKRAKSLRGLGIYGWAGIGALTPDE